MNCVKVPRDVSGLEVVKVLCGNGWTMQGQKGSHMYLFNSKKEILQVPMHKCLKVGTLLSIIERSGISKEEFLDQL